MKIKYAAQSHVVSAMTVHEIISVPFLDYLNLCRITK